MPGTASNRAIIVGTSAVAFPPRFCITSIKSSGSNFERTICFAPNAK